MSDVSVSGVPLVGRVPNKKAPQITLPKPQPFGAPVFIVDAVTPLAGETVLSLLMKRLARDESG
ncbi:hypothetical protein [Sulfitobacter aestuariivivens]|uniref:Uncharacterized protein n=1 Tax=Sulfitobacter aestuariivivens TaxID=2766981 RepID=A0A927D4E4_9RHOB|nr:hypothetical protein [Sulfitobacter aestuariivivens]MBD3664835.1 hypothetical protein [Sulfitobacter aestuariivivens]